MAQSPCFTPLANSLLLLRQELSNEVIKDREPERLVQVEAIREHATRFISAQASGDNAALGSVKQALLGLVEKFMVDVDRDMEDGLDLDTARIWKDQVHDIVNEAKLFQDGSSGDGTAPPAPTEPADCLAPLRIAIRIATGIAEQVAKEILDPSEAVLRSYAKQLGNSKKDIMTLSRSLMVGQAASVATEATRLANEAGEVIKSSREVIRAALRGLGVASDISEASGPTRAQRPPPARPVMGDLGAGWAMGSQPTASGWAPAYTPATTAWPPLDTVPRPRIRGTGGELSTLMRGMEYPRFRKEWWAYSMRIKNCATKEKNANL
jgi:hypothetical protein